MSKPNVSDPHMPAMTFREIADVLTLEEGVLYSEDRVRKIHDRALQKLRNYLNIN
jgi:DNA-directed RNA polymerase sigma subunit (sigma70/sigma32)